MLRFKNLKLTFKWQYILNILLFVLPFVFLNGCDQITTDEVVKGERKDQDAVFIGNTINKKKLMPGEIAVRFETAGVAKQGNVKIDNIDLVGFEKVCINFPGLGDDCEYTSSNLQGLHQIVVGSHELQDFICSDSNDVDWSVTYDPEKDLITNDIRGSAWASKRPNGTCGSQLPPPPPVGPVVVLSYTTGTTTENEPQYFYQEQWYEWSPSFTYNGSNTQPISCKWYLTTGQIINSCSAYQTRQTLETSLGAMHYAEFPNKFEAIFSNGSIVTKNIEPPF